MLVAFARNNFICFDMIYIEIIVQEGYLDYCIFFFQGFQNYSRKSGKLNFWVLFFFFVFHFTNLAIYYSPRWSFILNVKYLKIEFPACIDNINSWWWNSNFGIWGA